MSWILLWACGHVDHNTGLVQDTGPPSACDGYDTLWQEDPDLPQGRYGDVSIRPCELGNWASDADILTNSVAGGAPQIVVAQLGWNVETQSTQAELLVLTLPDPDATVVRQEDVTYATLVDADHSYLRRVDASSDLNGDGWKDALVTPNAGIAWVVLGPLDHDGAIQDQAVRLSTGQWSDSIYYIEPRVVGDVTGDGIPDIAVYSSATPGGFDTPTGDAVALLPGPFEDDIDLTTWDLAVGGSGGTLTGWSPIASGGIDADGDGIDDLVVGRGYNAPEGGDAILVFQGPIEYSRAADDMDAALGQYTYNYRLESWKGISDDGTGLYQEAGGDMNGDGYDDLIATNAFRDNGKAVDAGMIWVVPGPLQGKLDLDTVALARIQGHCRYNFMPYEVSTGGDVNGDDHLDLVVSVSDMGEFEEEPSVDPGTRLFFGPLEGTIPYQDGIEFEPSHARRPRINQDIDGDGIDDVLMAERDMLSAEPGLPVGGNYIMSGTQIWLSTQSSEWPRPWAPTEEAFGSVPGEPSSLCVTPDGEPDYSW